MCSSSSIYRLHREEGIFFLFSLNGDEAEEERAKSVVNGARPLSAAASLAIFIEREKRERDNNTRWHVGLPSEYNRQTDFIIRIYQKELYGVACSMKQLPTTIASVECEAIRQYSSPIARQSIIISFSFISYYSPPSFLAPSLL